MSEGKELVTGEFNKKIEGFVEVKGVNVHYVQEGEGPDLVLISGLLGSSRGFDFVLHSFAKNFRATAIDLPGMGVSGKYPKDRHYSVGEHVEDIVSVMDQMGIKMAGFVGDSYGCVVGLVAGIKHPERFHYLVLQGPPKVDFLRQVAKFPKKAAISIMGDVMNAKKLAYFARRLNPEFRHMSKEQLRNADTRFAAASPRTVVELGFELTKFDFGKNAFKLTVPTLVVEGTNPFLIPVSSTLDIRKNAPRSVVEVRRFEGSHTLLQQKPRQFVDAVNEFATRVKRAN